MIKKTCIFSILFASILANFRSYAQSEYLPLNNTRLSFYEKEIYGLNSDLHTAIKPIVKSEVNTVNRLDSIQQRKSDNLLLNGLLNEHFVSLTKNNVELTIDPVINAMGMYALDNGKSGHILANGLHVRSSYKNKLFFSSTYMYADAKYQSFYEHYIQQNNVIPGYGRANRYQQKYFNQYVQGYLSYTPNKHFNFQLGQGRNFIGDGYRSLLLSDNAFNYPYFKITTSIWKIKYMNLYAMQFDIRNSKRRVSSFDKKFSSTHYLSTRIGKRLTVGVFETVIWRGQDSLYNRGVDVNYLNPVIFFRPVEFSVGSPDNVLIGLNLGFKLTDKTHLYGQLMIDEFLLDELRANNGWWANKYGFQLGFKSFYKKLMLQGEYNTARPFTYTHSSVIQNYAHFNQPLAHPIGANFHELVGQVKWVEDRIQYGLKSQFVGLRRRR